MGDSEEPKDLAPTVGDGAHRIAKATISLMPLVGGVATELFSALVTPPLEKRRDKFLQFVYAGLKRLEKEIEGCSVEGLFQDEAFVTAFVRAARAAVSDHQKEKLEALRNAILNSASSVDLDENRRLMFINLIDSMTELHLQVLKFLCEPEKPLREMGVGDEKGFRKGSLLPHLREYFSIPDTDPHPLYLVINDLQASWLVVDDVYGEKTGIMLFTARVTPAGVQLVKFIKSPLSEDEPNGAEP